MGSLDGSSVIAHYSRFTPIFVIFFVGTRDMRAKIILWTLFANKLSFSLLGPSNHPILLLSESVILLIFTASKHWVVSDHKLLLEVQ